VTGPDFRYRADKATQHLAEPPDVRIGQTSDRIFDLAARQADVAEFTIVHLSQRFDRRTAVQMVYERLCPNPEPAGKSA
jgi:hypothetical protein